MKGYGIYSVILLLGILAASCGEQGDDNAPTQAEAMSGEAPLNPGTTDIRDTTGGNAHPGATNSNYRADRTQNEGR